MTLETNYLISFTDILCVEYECRKCGVKIVFPLNKAKAYSQCPSCHEDWINQGTKEEESIRSLIGYLRTANESLQGRQFSLKLQITAHPKS